MADEQPKIDPAVLQQAQSEMAKSQATDLKNDQNMPGSPQADLPKSQAVDDRKNAAFGQNQPTYDNGKVGRQDTPGNLRPAPAQSQDGASRYGGAAPPSVSGQSQAQPVQSQEPQTQSQDGASRYGASQSSQPQGPTQDQNRGGR